MVIMVDLKQETPKGEKLKINIFGKDPTMVRSALTHLVVTPTVALAVAPTMTPTVTPTVNPTIVYPMRPDQESTGKSIGVGQINIQLGVGNQSWGEKSIDHYSK
jgi:hypothetical protein